MTLFEYIDLFEGNSGKILYDFIPDIDMLLNTLKKKSIPTDILNGALMLHRRDAAYNPVNQYSASKMSIKPFYIEINTDVLRDKVKGVKIKPKDYGKRADGKKQATELIKTTNNNIPLNSKYLKIGISPKFKKMNKIIKGVSKDKIKELLFYINKNKDLFIENSNFKDFKNSLEERIK